MKNRIAFISLIGLLCVLKPYLAFSEEKEYGSIGIQIVQLYDPNQKNRIGSLIVTDVIKGSSAEENGIERADIVTHIAGKPTKGRLFEDIMAKDLRGKVGTKVELTIKRYSTRKEFKVTLTRKKT